MGRKEKKKQKRGKKEKISMKLSLATKFTKHDCQRFQCTLYGLLSGLFVDEL